MGWKSRPIPARQVWWEDESWKIALALFGLFILLGQCSHLSTVA